MPGSRLPPTRVDLDTIDRVFINCPFDPEYRPMFEAIVFAAAGCGLRPRCALEVVDGGQPRIDRILQIITDCQLGIHDISRTELDPGSGLPRFNMPFELGLFLGARHYGSGPNVLKSCLILDRERYRYQKFLSDIAGQDIEAHQNDPLQAITLVRNWLQTTWHPRKWSLPGGAILGRRYGQFRDRLPILCRRLQLTITELTFLDYRWLISTWLEETTD